MLAFVCLFFLQYLKDGSLPFSGSHLFFLDQTSAVIFTFAPLCIPPAALKIF